MPGVKAEFSEMSHPVDLMLSRIELPMPTRLARVSLPLKSAAGAPRQAQTIERILRRGGLVFIPQVNAKGVDENHSIVVYNRESDSDGDEAPPPIIGNCAFQQGPAPRGKRHILSDVKKC